MCQDTNKGHAKIVCSNGKLILSIVTQNLFPRLITFNKYIGLKYDNSFVQIACRPLVNILWQHARLFIGVSKSFASFCFKMYGRKV